MEAHVRWDDTSRREGVMIVILQFDSVNPSQFSQLLEQKRLRTISTLGSWPLVRPGNASGHVRGSYLFHPVQRSGGG